MQHWTAFERISCLLAISWGLILLNSIWIVPLLLPDYLFQYWIHPDYNQDDYRELLVFNIPFWLTMLALLRMAMDSSIKRWGIRSVFILLHLLYALWFFAMPHHAPKGCVLSLMIDTGLFWLLTRAFWFHE